jgi:hypothetical protein
MALPRASISRCLTYAGTVKAKQHLRAQDRQRGSFQCRFQFLF